MKSEKLNSTRFKRFNCSYTQQRCCWILKIHFRLCFLSEQTKSLKFYRKRKKTDQNYLPKSDDELKWFKNVSSSLKTEPTSKFCPEGRAQSLLHLFFTTIMIEAVVAQMAKRSLQSPRTCVRIQSSQLKNIYLL